MILSSSIVWFINHNNLFKLFQSSTSGWFILVHRNDISLAQSGRPLCKIYSSFMTTEWKVLSLLPCDSLTFTTVNSHLATSNVTTWDTSSPNSCTDSVIYYLIWIAIILIVQWNFHTFISPSALLILHWCIRLTLFYQLLLVGHPIPLQVQLTPLPTVHNILKWRKKS